MKNRLYNCPFPLIGLTGGIATGKSTAADYLRSQGHCVICADTLIKEIYQQPESLNFISTHFPTAINNYVIDFKKLRSLAFADKTLLEKLENFLYPSLEKQFNLHLPEQADFIFYDVPLLFEKKMQDKFDHVCLIYCSREKQKQRLKKRDQLNDLTLDQILAQQWDIEDKRRLADTVIDNSTSLEDLKRSLDQLLLKLQELVTAKK